MDIPKTIDSIIRQRKQQRLPEIEAAIERLKKAHDTVEQFNDFKLQLNLGGDEQPDALYSRLADISTDEFERKYIESLTELERLKARFSRDQVSISFVGRAGQGKSLVLQRISGLGSDVIPSSSGTNDCTGARSVIVNRPGQEPSADITFFTEQEFLEIINKYLYALFSGRVPQIRTLNAVRTLRIDELEKMIAGDAVKVKQMDHLRAYLEHAQELRGLLGTKITVPREEIEQYVAQYSHENTGVSYYNYLVVKEARIFAPFPAADCARIILVDTIGVGDTSLGVEDEMLRTVHEDSDAIVFMYCPPPSPNRARPDVVHYDLLNKIVDAVTSEYSRRMLFWLINRVETGNGRNADLVDAVLRELNGSKLPVAACPIVDCSSEDEVRDNLLTPVLNQLSTHLADIDRKLLDHANELLSDVSRAYAAISRSLGKAETALVNVNEHREFRTDIRNAIDKMTNDLKVLFQDYEKRKGKGTETEPLKECEPLKAAAEIKLKNILRSLPGTDRIKQEMNKGTQNQHTVLMNLGNELRINITNDFLGLNMTLDGLVRDMKREAVKCLADPDKGKLGSFVHADPDDPTGWINAMLDQLEDGRTPMIRLALSSLRDFDLKMENFLIYKVRCCLKPIDWLDQRQMPPIPGQDLDGLAENIRFQISHALNIICKDVNNELEDFYSFPNAAMYAVLRDFYDRATFAVDPSSGDTVREEWQDVYEDAIPQIWPEKYRALNARRERSEEWSALCKAVGECAVSGFFGIGIN